jgi:hypothetical protein
MNDYGREIPTETRHSVSGLTASLSHITPRPVLPPFMYCTKEPVSVEGNIVLPSTILANVPLPT